MDIQIFKDIMRTFIFLVCHCHKNHLIKPLLSWTAVIICLWYAMQVHVCDWLGDSSQAPATWFVKWNNYYIFYLDIPYPALVHSITKWNFFQLGSYIQSQCFLLFWSKKMKNSCMPRVGVFPKIELNRFRRLLLPIQEKLFFKSPPTRFTYKFRCVTFIYWAN